MREGDLKNFNDQSINLLIIFAFLLDVDTGNFGEGSHEVSATPSNSE